MATLLAVAGAAASRLLAANSRAAIEAAHLLGRASAENDFNAAVARYLAGRQQLAEGVMPVWARQIEASRAQMESAIGSLTERFSGIVQKLEQAVQASAAATGSVEDRDSGLVAVFAKSESDLAEVVASLRSATDSKAEMLDKIRGLNQYVEELQQMAAEVAGIAVADQPARDQRRHRGGARGRRRAAASPCRAGGAQAVRALGRDRPAHGREGRRDRRGDRGRRAAAEESSQAEQAARSLASESDDRRRAASGFRGVTDALEALEPQCSSEESVGIQAEVVRGAGAAAVPGPRQPDA